MVDCDGGLGGGRLSFRRSESGLASGVRWSTVMEVGGGFRRPESTKRRWEVVQDLGLSTEGKERERKRERGEREKKIKINF